jgi:zona occludens toxin
MLFLRTGLPGASKTLNTLKEIIEDPASAGRPIYYNNIKLLMLDIEVCSSFAGWFYGVYYKQLDDIKKKPLSRLLLKLHAQDELASLETFPHLQQVFESWIEFKGHINLWLSWVKKLYPSSAVESLQLYLDSSEPTQITIENLKQFNLHWNNFPRPQTWFELPRNSIIVIDECQQTFPPRPVGAKVPLHCSEFETHRHKGFDIHLVTQDAKLLDNHVRRLTGRHIHFFNPFASKRITRYQADKVFDPEDYFAKKAASKSVPQRDTKFYGLYWSADVHTHKSSFPKWILLLAAAPLVIVYFVYNLISGTYVTGISSLQPSQGDSPGEVSQANSPGKISQGNSPGEISQANSSYSVKSFNHVSKDTPLNGLCDDVRYAGYELQHKGQGRYVTVHFFTCELPVDENEKRDDDEPKPQILLDGSFMQNLGFDFDFKNNVPVLTYESARYVFPRY